MTRPQRYRPEGQNRVACRNPVAALVTTAALMGQAYASPPTVARATSTPVIDGHIAASEWVGATSWQNFVQRAPVPGAPASEQTELLLMHDGRMLYAAVRARGGRVTARALRPDASAIEGDDHITLVLDPQGSGRNGFLFRVNALGARQDALIFDGGNLQPAWDAAWSAAAKPTEGGGWTAEFAIPLSAMAAPAARPGRVWRFNAERLVAATGERMVLFGAVANRPPESLPDAGLLAALATERAGWGLRLEPALRLASRRGEERKTTLEPSLDAFWGVTPGITATMTMNSDFADAEIDDSVVSLSRFELFRPERRAFFNQDAGRFAFGGLDVEEPELLPFFSRRIALGSSVDAGLKLSGTAGLLEFGALAVQASRDSPEGQDRPVDKLDRAPRVGVLRVAAGLGEVQRVGIIATQGSPDGSRGRTLQGLDWQLRRNDIWGDRALQATLWTLSSSNPELGRGQAYGSSFSFQNEGPWFAATARRVDEAFEPPLGYVQERGVEKADIELGWLHRFDNGWSLLPRVFTGRRLRLDRSESGAYIGPNVELISLRDDVLGIEFFDERETLAESFDLLPGVAATAGSSRWRYAAVYVETESTRALSGELYVRRGGLYDGRLHEESAEIAWRPNAHWTLAGSLSRQDVRLASQRFIARTNAVRLEYTPSTSAHVGWVTQRDNLTGRTAHGLRARWRLDAARELQLAMDRSGKTAEEAASTEASLKFIWRWER